MENSSYETQLVEIVEFLSPTTRSDIKRKAANFIADLTGTPSGLKMIYTRFDLLKAIVLLVKEKYAPTTGIITTVLLNLSADENGAAALMQPELQIVKMLLDAIRDPQYVCANSAAGILGNITRFENLCKQVLEDLEAGDLKLQGLVTIFCNQQYNETGTKLHVLGNLFVNFSQISEGRKLIMDKSKHIFIRLLPYVRFEKDKARRNTILTIIRNCCLEEDYHEWLLSDEIDLVYALLSPLVSGKGITDKENDALPDQFQYMSEEKKIEDDVEQRVILLESLYKLSYMTDAGKAKMQAMNLIPLFKQYHDAEENARCQELVVYINGAMVVDEQILQARMTDEGGIFVNQMNAI